MSLLICLLSLLSSTLTSASTPEPPAEYLSDLLHRFIILQQGWGELGIDTCAHARGQTPLSLRIGDRTYARGLGHHASGEIVIDLGGEYETFEAEVGVQWQQGTTGSVVFQVYVDGRKRFDSGVMREADPPRPVRVSVRGAGELRLVVTDAGDGITCDCANWANARLIRFARPATAGKPMLRVDVAPFAQVVTSDPQRMDGCRSGRIEEYLAEDIILQEPLSTDGDGVYIVPTSAEAAGTIGLHWLERRRLTELRLRFASPPPPAQSVQLQAWVGESHWQGRWHPLPASWEAQGNLWVFRPDWRGVPGAMYGVRKVRWVFAPPSQPVRIQSIQAFSSSRWDEIELTLRLQSPAPVLIQVCNGEIVLGERTVHQTEWDGLVPLRLRVRTCKPATLKSDRTVLRLRLPDTAFGVAVDDVLTSRTVYVAHAGLMVSRDPSLTIDQHKQKNGRRRTVLERVRNLPEQTFEQAMAKTHHKVQNNGPILLSLACDNRKFIVEREGVIRYGEQQIQPLFADGRAQWSARHLHGGWLPVPVITWQDGEVQYRQTTFVAPLDNQPLPDTNGWLYDRTACIALIEAENTGEHPADGRVGLVVNPAGEVTPTPDGYQIAHDGKVTAVVHWRLAGWTESTQQGALSLAASLPPRGRRELVLILPAWDTPSGVPAIDVAQALARTERYWQNVLSDAAQIEIPHSAVLNVIRASQVHCLLAARNEENGRRVAAWIAAMAYGPLESEAHAVIRGMLMLGHREFAKRALDYFVHRYHPAGYLTTGYTLMGTGWHLWTLSETVALTGDTGWLHEIAPAVQRTCEWIVRQRQKTMRRGDDGQPVPEYGLMPPGVMADWNAYAYYFTLNGYYCAGLYHAAQALQSIGVAEADDLLKEAERFRQDILRAYRRTQAQMPVIALQNGTWIPGSPSQVHCPAPTAHLFPGEDANRSWAYDVELGAHQLIPQGILPAHSTEADWIVDYLEDVAFLESGWFDYPAEENRKDWFNLGGFSKVQPYYTRNPEIYALRRDPKPFIRSYFNMLATLLNEETLWLWEHFNNTAAWNKTHETGYFLQQTRFMLAMEDGTDLHLAPLIPSYWLKDGNTVGVHNLPTRFGVLSYRIRSEIQRSRMEAEITLRSALQAPATLYLHLRHPNGKAIRRVVVNGTEHSQFERDRIQLPASEGTMKVQVWF